MLFRTVLVVALVIQTLPVSGKDKKSNLAKDRIEVHTEYGPVVFQNVSVDKDTSGALVSGTVTNNTNRAWRHMAFIVAFRDRSGKEIKFGSTAGDTLMREVHVDNLDKGETKPLTSLTGGTPARLMVPLKGGTSDFDLEFSKDHSFYASRMVLALIQASDSTTLSHEDALIAIQFAVATNELQFTLYNKTQGPLSINWDEVSYIDLSGTAHRVIHQGVKLADRDKAQPLTTVPPGTKVKDLIAPSDNIEFDQTVRDWWQHPLLPPSQEILNYKGETFGVFMPITIDGKKKNYTFKLRIVDVEI